MKLLIAPLIAAVILPLFASCQISKQKSDQGSTNQGPGTSNDVSIVGVWEMTEMLLRDTVEGVSYADRISNPNPGAVIYTFDDKGTLTINTEGHVESHDYAISGSTLTLDNSTALVFLIEDLSPTVLVISITESINLVNRYTRETFKRLY